MKLRGGLQVVLAAGAMLACPLASAQPTTEPAPHHASKQELYDAHQAHYAAMLEGFNNATVYARQYGSTSPTLACDFYKQALGSMSDAQDDLKWIIDALEENHQDAASYHTSFDTNAAALVQWKSSYARNCTAG